ncbi:DNA repair helicase XPB [Marininema halotolerans]|uniref:DNA 3'-5' helicase n=1 Tax=Marininema halotolerans TaxID=1155944 RepID=A0A1I6RPP4_9BACL|nr:DNA repair helicase XPB [Marininema halotolerans]SFS66713.1 DNA excision repair protein ERCC-3 [Marininema halotolerans]
MEIDPHRPLIVQNDRTVWVEVDHPDYDQVREGLSFFAELVKSPEYLHTYRITPLSLWNVAAVGWQVDEILSFLQKYSKFPLSPAFCKEIEACFSRFGRIRIIQKDHRLLLKGDQQDILTLTQSKKLTSYLQCDSDGQWVVAPEARGMLKKELIHLGWPVWDQAGFSEGEALSLRLCTKTRSGESFALRDYQQKAIEAYCMGDQDGHGVLVLPCGAGKTVIGLGVMERVGRATLILTPHTTSVRQWVRELLDKTTLRKDQIGEYSGEKKVVKTVTVATYQILTHRDKQGEFIHMDLFNRRDWGLIVYDEVHLLPAPVFRATADLQAKRRLGLTATLIREDGREKEVFSLIGPKRVDIPWKELEEKDFLAEANCTEIRTPLSHEDRMIYADAAKKHKYRIAAENPAKEALVQRILIHHQGERVLVIGQYLRQLKSLATRLQLPLITGQTCQEERETFFQAFRQGEIPVLIVSKIANFGIDLPDANVAIQLSGTFGSRQEEAQRLGRILRPKNGNNQAYFYHLVSSDTVDQEYALHRQRFLVEQGYPYQVIEEEQWRRISWNV